MILIDLLFHTDEYIKSIIQNFGSFSYVILFIIIFMETGIVFTPFLPGDSLLFASGIFASIGALNLFLLFFLFSVAAILGDTANYAIGHYFGNRIILKFIKTERVEMAKQFFEKHGKKTIIFARFVPIVRTITPFVAGIGKMNYFEFLFYNIVGGIAWVALFLFSGFYFGGIPIIKENLSVVIIVIVIVSFLPLLIRYIKRSRR
ncbi:MAG: VTT domain-containing protein [Nanoarchaeota archaeon]|nr:VTT domain-containing protein [Nanoarchaeota archaeon]